MRSFFFRPFRRWRATFNLRSLNLTLASISSSIPTARPPPSSNLRLAIPYPTFIFPPPRNFSSDSRRGGDGDDRGPPYVPQSWTLTPDDDDDDSSVFGSGESDLSGIADDGASAVDGDGGDEVELKEEEEGGDIFEAIDKELASKRGNGDDWETAEGYEPWTLGEEEKEVFESGEGIGMEGLSAIDGDAPETGEDHKKLEEEEQALTTTLKGPSRAFGDLIAASGITDAMLDSLIALKDLEGVEGLPPLREIEDMRYEKSQRKSPRYEMEQKKQEEIAKSYVRRVDEKGRAYGTGRRKCSIARVWIQPGDGKFIINDKEFDAYFPNLDHRADLLRPFSETKTLGLWDVQCTVKGGGVSVSAVVESILIVYAYIDKKKVKLEQFVWELAGHCKIGSLDCVHPLGKKVWEVRMGTKLHREVVHQGIAQASVFANGFVLCKRWRQGNAVFTKDPRVVERKKPGKAKARKSFQWVKR
ncbi:hypothetical protein ACLOJK_024456 [Asimina triloba]